MTRTGGSSHTESGIVNDVMWTAAVPEPEKPSETGTTAAAQQDALPLGPCCDDVDCSPASPLYINCSIALDCSVATCPLDPRKPIVGGRLITVVPDVQGDPH
jgi:hypothetical protein